MKSIIKEATTLLRDLIRIPSVNHGAGGAGEEWEGKLGEFVYNYLWEIGLKVEKQVIIPGRFNVIGSLDGKDQHHGFLLEAHLDTVPAGNMIVPPFEGLIKDNKIYGRGACDTKASLAAMLLALKILKNFEPPPVNLFFAATVDEEYSFTGIRALVKKNLPVNVAICGEPTELNPLIAHAGCVRWQVRTIGEAAHSSRPEDGKNAIYAMGEVIRLIAAIDERLKAKKHHLIGRPSICLSLIQGGEQVNMVPQHCQIDLDRRTIPGEDPWQIWRELNTTMASVVNEHHRGIKVQFDDPYLIYHALDTNPNDEFSQYILGIANKYNPARFITGRYGTHASELAEKGIKSLVFGPGSIKHAHSDNEYVEIEQLCQAVEILVETVRNYQGQGVV